MKKFRQILAIAGIVLLLLLYGSTMVFALMDSPNSRNLFQLSIGMTILVPVVLYAFLLVAKHLENRNRKPEPASRIKNIVFDVGNVLVDFQWDAYLDSMNLAPDVRAAVKQATWPTPQWEERDRGLRTQEEDIRVFQKLAPGYEEEVRRIMEKENDSLHLFDYSRTWIQYLQSKSYRTYLLSNVSTHMLEGFREKMDFLSQMDGAVFSCEVHSLKPEPEIYQVLFDTYHLKPEECIFLDDRVQNVEAARKAGMEGIVFTDFKSAARKLEEYGIG